jgi:hypothetical protein
MKITRNENAIFRPQWYLHELQSGRLYAPVIGTGDMHETYQNWRIFKLNDFFILISEETIFVNDLGKMKLLGWGNKTMYVESPDKISIELP